MSIQSARDRRAVAGMSVGWGVTPDNSEGLAWRVSVAWTYSGLYGLGAPLDSANIVIADTLPMGVAIIDLAPFSMEINDLLPVAVLIDDSSL